MDLTHISDKRAYFRVSLPVNLWRHATQRYTDDQVCQRLRMNLEASLGRIAGDGFSPGAAEAEGRPSDSQPR